MGVGCDEVDEAVVEEAPREVGRRAPVVSEEGACRDLHEDAGEGHVLDERHGSLRPAVALDVSHDRLVAGLDHVDEQALHVRWQRGWRHLDEHMLAEVNGQDLSSLEAAHHVRAHMGLATGDEGKFYAFLKQTVVEFRHPAHDLRWVGVVDAWQEMWRAGHHLDTVLGRPACHVERHLQTGCAVVDFVEDVAVKIDHRMRLLSIVAVVASSRARKPSCSRDTLNLGGVTTTGACIASTGSSAGRLAWLSRRRRCGLCV